MPKYCPQLRIQFKNIKVQYDVYILAFEQAKSSKEYEKIFGIQEKIKLAINQLKFDVLCLNPEALKQELKQRLKLNGIDNFFEGRAAVCDQSGSFYIDLDGREITKSRFESAWPFFGGRAVVSDKAGSFYIDLDGKEITKARFKNAMSFRDGKALVYDQSGTYFIDLYGNRINE